MKKLILLVAMLMLVGCGTPRIDASSEEALKTSIEKVRKSLDGEDRARFEEMVVESNAGLLFAKSFGGAATLTGLWEPVDGMTGTEIVAMDRERRAAREEERAKQEAEKIAQKRKELGELEAIDAAHEASLELVQRVQVSNAQIVSGTSRIGTTHWLLASVKNGLDVPLSRVLFEYEVRTPGEAYPWRKNNDGVFMIETVLAQGEEKELRGRRQGLSDFAPEAMVLRDRPEAKLTVIVTGATNTEGESVVTPALNSYQASKMELLRKELEIE